MKLFTVEEANRTLPLVRRIVEDVVREHRRWLERIFELDVIASSTRAEADRPRAEQLQREVQVIAQEIEGFERELEALGIQLKDRRDGLVDFPSEHDGRIVLLCWKYGEPEVRFWHEKGVGYAGRQPLSPSLVG